MSEYDASPRTAPAATGPDRRPPGLMVATILGAALLAVLVWQFIGVADDGLQVQVLAPDLHPLWQVLIVSAVGAGTVCSFVAWGRKRWTMRLAVVNTAANATAAAPIIALTVEGGLFAPSLPERIATTFETTADWSGLIEPFILLVAGFAVWDSLDGVLRARPSGVG